MMPRYLALLLCCSFTLFAGIEIEKKGPAGEDRTTEARKVAPGQMNNLNLERLLRIAAVIDEGRPGYWAITYGERPMLVITDESHNRMRIISPVIEVDKLKPEDYVRLMEANFQSALDARYAVYNGLLWSVFIHPLGELSGHQFLDALDQVKQLADTYGTYYTSTGVVLNQD